jgi:hypothetical protein
MDKETLKVHLDKLFDMCKHGDQEHQDWLREKFNSYISSLEDKHD